MSDLNTTSDNDNNEQCFTVCESNITEVLLDPQGEQGGEDNVLLVRFLTANFAWFAELLVPQFEALKGGTVRLELIETPFGQLAGDIINEAQSKIGLYDGFLTPPSVTGSIVRLDGWHDLSDYINESADHIQDWSDILLGYRQYIAQYQNKILMYPLDGDVLSLYYRKDILKAFGFDHPPRTWDEYETIAATVHGQVYQEGDTTFTDNNTTNTTTAKNQTLVGSCVARARGCALPYFTNVILASLTQTLGPRQGHLFDTNDFSALSGPALLQTLQWMEMQVKYGAASEFDGCITAVNYQEMALNEEHPCVMTINWGNSFKRYLQDGDSLRGNKYGVAPTPGSNKVLDRDRMELVDCDADKCRHGDYYEDIGHVNRAPYLAFGGWGCAVNNYTDPRKKRIATEFCAFASSKAISMQTIIPNATGQHTGGQDPYRRSHLDLEAYVRQGYERDAAKDFIDTIEASLESENVVTDIRFPTASDIHRILEEEVHDWLNATKYDLVPDNEKEARRVEVAQRITDRWQTVIDNYQAGAEQTSLLEIYQRLRDVYVAEEDLNQISSIRGYGFALAGIAIVCAVLFAVWAFWNQNRNVVRAAQPFFLVVICVGVVVLASSIIPLAYDESFASVTACDMACTSFPWLLTLGWTIIFSALFAKLWRINRVMKNARRFRRVQINTLDVLWPFGVMFSLNAILLTVWTIVDPPFWTRIEISETESYGTCTLDLDSVVWKVLLGLIVTVNGTALVLANVQAYQTRALSDEFGESKYIGLIMMSFLQLVLVGVPILFLIEDDPSASYMMRSSIVFVLCMSVLLLLFVPKMAVWFRELREPETPRSRRASSCGNGYMVRKPTTFSQQPSQQSQAQFSGGSSRDVVDPRASVVTGAALAELERRLRETDVNVDELFEKSGIDTKNLQSSTLPPTRSTNSSMFGISEVGFSVAESENDIGKEKYREGPPQE